MITHRNFGALRPGIGLLLLLLKVAVYPGESSAEPAAAQNSPQSDQPAETRMHRLDVRLFSLIPGQGISSVRDSSGPGAMITGVGGMVGPAYTDQERKFGVQISPKLQEGKYVADIKLTPWPADSVIQARSLHADLSDMKAQSVELGRDENGRVYLLSLLPSVQITPPEVPKPISGIAETMANLQFRNSPVILNDDQYVGTILGSGGSGGGSEKAWIDIPGAMRVDFALVPFKGAEVMGSLKDGLLRLSPPDGTRLDVFNVSFGPGANGLPGGPWQVWGRWQAPTMSADEAVSKTLALLEQEKAAGNPMLDSPGFKEIIERLHKGKPMMSSGVSGIGKSDRVEPGEQ